MTRDEFWALIGLSFGISGGDKEIQLHFLHRKLATIEPEELVSFQGHLNTLHHRAETTPHLGTLINRMWGCSDEGIEHTYFGLISRGRAFCDSLLNDLDLLGELDLATNYEFESLWNLGPSLYEERTGESFPHDDVYAQKESLNGDYRPELTDETIKDLYPRVWHCIRPIDSFLITPLDDGKAQKTLTPWQTVVYSALNIATKVFRRANMARSEFDKLLYLSWQELGVEDLCEKSAELGIDDAYLARLKGLDSYLYGTANLIEARFVNNDPGAFARNIHFAANEECLEALTNFYKQTIVSYIEAIHDEASQSDVQTLPITLQIGWSQDSAPNLKEIERRRHIAYTAIKDAFGTEGDKYGATYFVARHLEEVWGDYWEGFLGTRKPEPRQVLDVLVLRSHWGDEFSGGLDMFDFTLPGEVTDYVICVRFNQRGDVEEIAMES